jgi:hypothetical protein
LYMGAPTTTMTATRNSLSAACPAARSLTPLLIGREGALKTGEMNSGQVVERQADLLQRGRKGTMPPGAAGDLLCRGPSGVLISAFPSPDSRDLGRRMASSSMVGSPGNFRFPSKAVDGRYNKIVSQGAVSTRAP